MLRQIHKEKDEEMVKVDMWCHFGHAYITKVDEGKRSFHISTFEKRTKLQQDAKDSYMDKHCLLRLLKYIALS